MRKPTDFKPDDLSINFDCLDTTQYNIVPTHWFDMIDTLSSSYSVRPNFRLYSEVYVDGTYSWTTTTSPFNGYIDAYVNDIAKDYLSYDENWYTNGVDSNPNSFKDAYIDWSIGFSRRLEFTSIEAYTYSTGSTSSVVIKVNYEPNQCLLEPQDRVLMVKTDGAVDEYNTFGIVLSVSNINGWMILDIPYVPYQYAQTGYIYEGTSFYDYAIVNDLAQITTLNDHNLTPGDQIVISMDTQGRGVVRITATAGDVITELWAGDYELLHGNSVSYTTTNLQFLTDIRDTINSNNTIDGFFAYLSFSSLDLYIFTGRNTNYGYSGVGLTYSGTVSSYTASTVRYLGGYDELGRGYNPQITGYYIVDSVPSSNTFVLNSYLPTYYNNEAFTDRGTIYALTDYKFSGITQSSTYSYLFASLDSELGLRPLNNLNNVFENLKMGPTGGYFMSSRTFLNNGAWDGQIETQYTTDFYSTYELFTLDVLKDELNSANNMDKLIVERTFAATSDIVTFSVFFTDDEKWTIGVGPWNLNEYWYRDPADVSSFTNPGTDTRPIPDDIESYTIYGIKGTQSVTQRFTFVNKCSNRDTFQLTWLNEWGAWDYWTFTSPQQGTYKMSKSTFYKSGNYRDGVTQVTSDPSQRGLTTYRSNNDYELKLTSGFLNLKESKVLQSLIRSGNVYLIMPDAGNESGNEFIYPVTILNEELKLHSPTSKLRYYEIDIVMSGYNYFNRQNIN